MKYNYTTERYEASTDVASYIEQCVDVAQFLECCKVCPNYSRTWSCPSYDFDPMDIWKRYKTLKLIGLKICFPASVTEKTYTQEEKEALFAEVLWTERRKLTAELFELEKEYPGSFSLSAGSCDLCKPGTCTRLAGRPCRFPDKMRYSIESIGGNVGLTVTKYLHQELLWIEKDRIPEHFMLVCGLLIP